MTVCKDELKVMMSTAQEDQKSIYRQLIREMKTNSASFVSGAAGTGKSYILRMIFAQVFKLAPTGVAAHNIGGQTLHRFFGMANRSLVPNYQTLDECVKLYPKLILLIDEYSMISSKLLESINEALIKSTQRSSIMGGVKTIFFGDIAQLLPVQKNEGAMWDCQIYNSVNRYNLTEPIRQKERRFIDILDKVRLYNFDQSVIEFLNERTVHKSELPDSCLRLYTTRKRVRLANEKDYENFPGDGYVIQSHDTYTGTKGTAARALKETRLLQSLYIKVNMPIMLIQNLNTAEGWVNGTIAQIEYVEDENICLRKSITNVNGNVEDRIYWIQRIIRNVPGTSYTRSQFPIVPAFASTIHKSQSATIDCVGIHLDNMLTHGQMYVALAIKRKYGCEADAIEIIRKKTKTSDQTNMYTYINFISEKF